MKVLGNILWIILGGLFTSLYWFFTGLLLYITIIGIPFGKQCMKMAKLTLTPFGSNVEINFDKHPIANIIWLILFGWELALGHLTSGIVLCATIIGIPFGIQYFKMMKLALLPFGSELH